MPNVKIVGVGRYQPPHLVTTEEIAEALPGSKPASWVIDKTGVRQRYYLHPLNIEEGRTEVDSTRHSNYMALQASRQAVEMSGWQPQEIDGLIHVTCTPDEAYFGQPAVGLANDLRMRWDDTFVEHLPAGCGGFMVGMQSIKDRMLGSQGRYKRALLVASNYTSAFFDREAYMAKDGKEHPIASWLSLQLFGDGAAAVAFELTDDPDVGILASFLKWTPDKLVVNGGGGARFPAWRCEPWRGTYFVEGQVVEQRYREFMFDIVPLLLGKVGLTIEDVHRFYLHPANRRLVEEIVQYVKLPINRAPINVDVIGNISAASTPFLMRIDIEQGKTQLGSGQLVLFAALGAGMYAGGHLVRL